MKTASSGLVLPGRAPIVGAFTAFLLACLSLTAGAQQPAVQDQVAPPPLKIITHAERLQLEEIKDPKARIKTTIELADGHLAKLEAQATQHEYDNAAAEAGMYWALLENGLAYLKTIERDNNRRRDLYKRFELALRAQGPRLNAVRRTTPAEYSIWIKEIETYARDCRTEALNAFYGDTVVRDSQTKPNTAKEDSKPPQEN
jgi:hypothetical protein